MHPVLEVLLAQLIRNGTLTAVDLETMKRRLIEGDTPDEADAINGIILSDLIDDPATRRATLYPIDGGNGAD